MRRKRLLLLAGVAVVGIAIWWWSDEDTAHILPQHFEAGEAMDSLNGVVVYCNGGMNATHGRNVVDGYNVGLKYQCVEFAKRYYLEHFHHRMPNSYGHAKDLFDTTVADGALNPARGLLQFGNGSGTKPRAGDLLVLNGWTGNPYGHVAIVSNVEDDELEVIQQNTGSSRTRFDLHLNSNEWTVDNTRVLGWLRMPGN